MTSLTGGGGTSSGERGVTWSGRERERRDGGTIGLTGTSLCFGLSLQFES